MAKITKSSLTQLAQEMHVLAGQEQQECVGGANSTQLSHSNSLTELNNAGGVIPHISIFPMQEDCFQTSFDTPSAINSDSSVSSIFTCIQAEGAIESLENSMNSGGVYDGYPGWDKLTDQEKDFIISHPFLAMDFKKNSDKALEATKNLSGAHNGYGDAVRHCYWSALNQMDVGLDSNSAMQYGNAHESSPSNPNDEKKMDLHNNAAGYELGKRALREGWSEERLFQEVLQLAGQGKLQLSPRK